MSTVNPVEVIAEALAKHHARWATAVLDYNDMDAVSFQGCSCEALDVTTEEAHAAHQASVIAALPNIAIVHVPTEQMTDRSYVADSIQDRPMWLVGDSWSCISEHGVEFETDSQNAYGTVPVDGIADLAAVLLAAARVAGGES